MPAEPPDHAIGRSRGGLTTKVHALTDADCAPVTMMLSTGQAGDTPHLLAVLELHRTLDRRPFRLLADKAYSHPSTRQWLRKRRIPHTIPERSDQVEHRKRRGSAGGRWA